MSARELHLAGWAHRPARLLARARAACPAANDAELAKTVTLATEPGADAATLWQQLNVTRARRDDKSQRALSARWVAAAEAAAGSSARLGLRPTGDILGGDDDASVVVVSDAQGVALIDGPTGLPTHFIDTLEAPHHAHVSGDRVLFVGSSGIQIDAIASGQRLQKLSWTNERYAWAAFVHGGKHVVAVGARGWNGAIRVFDVATGNNVGDLSPPGSDRFEHAALIDDDHVLIGNGDKLLVVDLQQMLVETELTAPSTPTHAKPGELVTVAASPSKVVAAGDRSGRVLVWQLPKTSPVVDVDTLQYGPKVAMSADGARLTVGIRAGFDGEVRTYAVGTGKALKSHPVPGDTMRFAAGGTRVMLGGRRGDLHLQDDAGKDLWPAQSLTSEIGGVALSRGLLIAQEARAGHETSVRAHAFFRQHARRFEAEGYREDVLAISPSGRYAAAVVSRDGRLWGLESGNEESFRVADGRGFPEALTFDGERTLRLSFERPASSWFARYPFDAWKADIAPREDPSGFGGEALSSRGELVIREDGKLFAARSRKVIASGIGAYAFSGDGALLFTGLGKKLTWFDADGAKKGERVLPCEPRNIAVDHRGQLAVATCGSRIFTVGPSTAPRETDGGLSSPDAVHLSPNGHLIAVHEDEELRFFTAADLTLAATLTLQDGEPLVVAPDHHVMFWTDTPRWQQTAVCRIGRRAYPFEACQDRLMDDALLDALLGG